MREASLLISMKTYQRIVFTLCDNAVAKVELNRPDIRNAFDDVLIAELREVFGEIAKDQRIRVMVLSGRGKTFCAGADMNWMRRMKDFSYEQNYQDSYALSQMLYELFSLPIPTIAKVQGAAVGGGVGLVAACDIIVAASDTMFSLSEVRLGLVPACISPYLLNRVTRGLLRGYFLTGVRFPAARAKEIGLINEVAEPDRLDQTVDDLAAQILSCGPQALKMAKELLARVPQMKQEEWLEYTSKLIADLRVSQEGQEGLTAFLEKREPSWKTTTTE